MIRLYKSELRRLTARRTARYTALALFAIATLVLLRLFTWSEPDTEESRQRRVAAAVAECEAAKTRGEIPQEAICSENVFVSSNEVNAKNGLEPTTKTVAVFAAMAAFVIASSYVGADWSAGTLQALLFWEPRRPRVLAAKALALLSVSLAFLVALWVFVYGGVWLTAALRGSTAGLTGGDHVSNLLTLGRGAVMMSLAALFAYGLAGLTRFSASAPIFGFGYLIVFELIIGNLRPNVRPWLLISNVDGLLNLRGSVVPGLDAWEATLRLGAYAALMVAAFALVFTRRDVT